MAQIEDISTLSARTMAQGVASGSWTAESLVRRVLDRLDDVQRRTNCLTYWNSVEALERAKSVDDKVRGGAVMPLAGVPIVVKDNIAVAGQPLTCSPKILAGYRSPFSSTVVQLLIKSGAIPLARANCDEFAMGSTNETSAYGPVRNPWDATRVAGGSSGGSAAAVGAGLVPLALGSDTGGSVRLPAAYCGIIGLKPGYGALSRLGLVAYGSSLDQIGVFARDLNDLSLVLPIVSQADPLDATWTGLRAPIDEGAVRTKSAASSFKMVSLATSNLEEVDASIRAAYDEKIRQLKDLGVAIEERSIPALRRGIATYYVLATAEAASNLSRFDGVRYGPRPSVSRSVVGLIEGARDQGFGLEVKRRIALGTFVLSAGYQDAYYNTAVKLRQSIAREFCALVDEFDGLLLPTAPRFPPHIAAEDLSGSSESTGQVSEYGSDVFTVGANLSGLPAMSVPIGWTLKDGSRLPMGMQVMARSEAKVLEIGRLLS